MSVVQPCVPCLLFDGVEDFGIVRVISYLELHEWSTLSVNLIQLDSKRMSCAGCLQDGVTYDGMRGYVIYHDVFLSHVCVVHCHHEPSSTRNYVMYRITKTPARLRGNSVCCVPGGE